MQPMNILLVDDDRFVLASLEQNMDWKALGFHNVFMAANVSQAKQIIKNNSIQILVTDIDMPQGTGIDLLAWVRENGYEMQTIFMTNYADFTYAQKAIELQSLKYYLKPIEFDKLAIILKEAIEKAELAMQAKSDANIWVDTHTNISKHFWNTYLKRGNSYTHEVLQQELLKCHLPYTMTDQFFLIQFDLFPYQLSEWNELLCHFKNSNQIFTDFEAGFLKAFHGIISKTDILLDFNHNKYQYIAIIEYTKKDLEEAMKIYANACDSLMTLMKRKYDAPIACYLGVPTTFHHFHSMLNKLELMQADMIDCRDKIFFLQKFVPINAEYEFPNPSELESLLNTRNKAGFIACCENYLQTLSKARRLNYYVLSSFFMDINQLLYSYLKSNGILAHKLLQGATSDFLLEQATKSLEDMLMYLSFLTHTALDYITFSASQKSVARIICDYIDQHYAEDINRLILAEIVYLDPDYTARLFKKEVGNSLGNYIIQKRIAVAKDLLRNTDLPINLISDKVGYGNYSYFTKLFKKETNFTPVDYRRLMVVT
jgi:two-component system response regulator YesN